MSLTRRLMMAASGAVLANLDAVRIEAGGFSTGLASDGDTLLLRTDVAGIFKWTGSRWQDLIVGRYSGAMTMGCEGVAVAGDTIIAAFGLNVADGNGVFLKSTNGGDSWATMPVGTPVGANEDWRWTGSRMAITGSTYFFASRTQGLFRSTDSGATWAAIASGTIPFGTATASRGNPGVCWVVASGATVYCGVSREGVYRSTDTGATWTKIVTLDAVPMQAVLASGTLWMTWDQNGAGGQGYVSKWDGSAHTTYQPGGNIPYGPIASTDGTTAWAARANTPFATVQPNEFWASTNGGGAWTNQTLTASQQPGWVPFQGGLSSFIGGLQRHGADLWLCGGIGVYRLTGAPTGAAVTATWRALGTEIQVAFDCRVHGGVLVTAYADFMGHRHASGLNVAPTKQHYVETFNTITGIDSNGTRMVMVGNNHSAFSNENDHSGWSSDGGATWTKFAALPPLADPLVYYDENRYGQIAIAPNNNDNLVWCPARVNGVYTSANNGGAWTLREVPVPVNGITNSAITHLWSTQKPLAFDRVTAGTCYLYYSDAYSVNWRATFYRSTDYGVTWEIMGDDAGYDYQTTRVAARPGNAGHVWVGNETGLWRSTNGGAAFTAHGTVTDCMAIYFVSATEAWIVGTIGGVTGVYRSTNSGDDWAYFGAYAINVLERPSCLAVLNGVPIVGTTGRGFRKIAASDAPAAPVITGSPTIAGEVAVGETLTASPASRTGYPTPVTTWQWTRDAVDISGATAATYALVRADVGALIRVRQIETNSEGTANATSDPVARMAYGDNFAADSSGEWALGQEAVDGTKAVTGGSLVYTKGAGDGLRPRIVVEIAVTTSTLYRVKVPAATGTANRKETWVSTASNGDFGAAITSVVNNAALDETFTPSITPVYLVMRAGTDSATGETVAIASAVVREE